jgi:hypothetical protein
MISAEKTGVPFGKTGRRLVLTNLQRMVSMPVVYRPVHQNGKTVTARSSGEKQAFKLLFFFYFLVYAVSPLTYTVSGQGVRGHGYTTRRAPSAGKNIHVLLWELILEKVTAKDEASPARGDSSILIKKKRALMPEDASAKLFSPGRTCVRQDRWGRPSPVAGKFDFSHIISRGTPKGFHSLYAGHSPPSLS